MANKINTRTELGYKKVGKWNRERWQNMRSVLQALSASTEPLPYSRLLYICRTTYVQLPHIFADLLSDELIEVVKEKQQKCGIRRQIVITKKGRRVLHLLDKQAQLIPKAGWLLENTQ